MLVMVPYLFFVGAERVRWFQYCLEHHVFAEIFERVWKG
jgi:hypothetical protein